MRRIPHLFIGLTAQLRLFTAVMGLTYIYSIAAMCQDDTTLMERIRARDEAGAVRVWHRKMDRSWATATLRPLLEAVRAPPGWLAPTRRHPAPALDETRMGTFSSYGKSRHRAARARFFDELGSAEADTMRRRLSR